MAGDRGGDLADVLVSTAGPAYTVGLVRIAFGAVAIGWTISLLPDLYALFGPHGVEPQQPQDAYQWGVFAIWTSDHALLIGWIVLLVSSVALTIGWRSRLATMAVFVLILSFEHRDVWVFNSGDLAVRIEALFLAISPSGAALSLDQVHSTGKFWSAQQAAAMAGAVDASAAVVDLSRVGAGQAEWQRVAAGHRRVLRSAAAGHATAAHAALVYEQRAPDRTPSPGARSPSSCQLGFS